MICKKCFNGIADGIVGQTNQANETAKSVSTIPEGYLILDNSRAIPLYIEAEKPITRGKRKGELKKVKGTIFIKASYCAKCGTKFEDKTQEKEEA